MVNKANKSPPKNIAIPSEKKRARTIPEYSDAMPLRGVIAVLMIASALLLSPIGSQLEENFGLPQLFLWRGERPPPPSVALVALDEESSVALALPDIDQLDRWPRSIYARLLHILAEKGVSVVVVDIAFLEARDSIEDNALATALRAAGNVVILKMLDRITPDPNTGDAVEWQLMPHPLFSKNAAAVGVFTLPDHALKKYTTLFPRTPEGIEAAMPLIALQIYYPEARDSLLHLLRTLDQQALAEQLSNEQNPAFFAAQIHSALAQQPALANRLQIATQSLTPDAAQHLRILLNAWQTNDPVYFNFYGPQRTIPTLSLSEVLLQPNSAAVNSLHGKAVFIGLSERFRNQRDYFFTVYTQGQSNRISGVEVAATLFANLQQHNVLRPLAPWQQIAVLLLWGGLLAFAARQLSPARWLLLTLALTVGYALLAVRVFDRYALWLPIMVPLAVATPAFTLLAIWSFYRRSAFDARVATDALSLYIPPEIAASVGKNREQLLAEQRELEAICLLTDIVGFTTLSEQREPGYMHALMNRYYSDVVAEVEQHGGIVANIVGDGLLALWPIPHSLTADAKDNSAHNKSAASRAACTALAIVAATDRMRETLGETLTTCIGIHCGTLSLGHLGAGQHFEYAPVGDAINTTARIEAYNRQLGSRILLSEPVRQKLLQVSALTQFSLRNHGEIMLKGKREPLALYELLAAMSQSVDEKIERIE